MANRGVSDEINPNKAPPTKLTAVRKPTVASAVSIVFVRGFFGRYRQPIPDEKTGANAVILADLSMSGGMKTATQSVSICFTNGGINLAESRQEVDGHVEYLTHGRRDLRVADDPASPTRSQDVVAPNGSAFVSAPENAVSIAGAKPPAVGGAILLKSG
jgi:hypothetical protein